MVFKEPTDLSLIWKAYKAFLASEDLDTVAASLSLSRDVLAQYLEHWEPFAQAATAAKNDRLPAVFQDLDAESKLIWCALNDRDVPEDKKQAALIALANNGERERQKLLAWGLMNNHFDVNSACRALNISTRQYQKWLKTDSEFAELIAAVQAAKRNFVEGTLMKLVATGDTKATIFAAERLLREDYGQKIEHSGAIDHNHTAAIDLGMLPVHLRAQVIEAIRGSGLVDPDGLLASDNFVDATAVKRLN